MYPGRCTKAPNVLHKLPTNQAKGGNLISIRNGWLHGCDLFALMDAADDLGMDVAVEVHRDTCTETPEKTYALAEGYEMEDRAKRVVMSTEDAREGPRAFMEKRSAVYRGC